MKKVAAILISVLFYIGVFLLTFRFSMGGHTQWFLYGFPLMIAGYFVIAGYFFSSRLHLNRWYLWLSMNFIGGLFSWIILIIRLPILLMSGFVLFLMGPVIGVLAAVWAVVGLGFLCVKCVQHRAAISNGVKKTMAACPERIGRWFKRAKRWIQIGGLLLLILAAVSLYVGIKGFSSVRTADSYEDEGVHTFTPYDILPVQVKNNGIGRNRRMYPTKTVYMVYYRTTDGSGYQWRAAGGSARVMAEQLYSRGPMERRVLSIPADNTYITIAADQTAESYTAVLQRKYVLILGLSGGYILVCLAVFVVGWSSKKMRKEALL